jgi:DNA-binding transcriptional ArsR family regulator
MKLTNRTSRVPPAGPAGSSAPGGPSAPGPDLDAVFQALAHPVRRGILEALREGDHTVGELARPLPLSRPAVSQHLDVLEKAGLVERVPSGRENRCRLTGAPLGGAADWLHGYARYWTGAFDRLERHFLESTPPKEPEP